MKLDKDKIIVIDEIEYYILAEEEIKNKKYFYVAEIRDNDITGNFFVYKEDEKDIITKITNSEELKDILPIMINSMNNQQ